VRAATISLLAWCTRCPKTRSMLFSGRYDDRTIQPINNAAKDYARFLESAKVDGLITMDEWRVAPESPDYEEETGICLSDGCCSIPHGSPQRR
jgi:hypothetical protein